MRLIKSRIMLWTGHVTRMGEKRVAYMVLVTIPEGKRPHESLEVDGRIILKWIFKMWD